MKKKIIKRSPLCSFYYQSVPICKEMFSIFYIVLRSDYGIQADTKLISQDSAFSLASILLTSDLNRRVRVSTNLALVLSQVFPL